LTTYVHMKVGIVHPTVHCYYNYGQLCKEHNPGRIDTQYTHQKDGWFSGSIEHHSLQELVVDTG